MYLLDANVFIQAKQRTYCFDFCPGFWDWIDLTYARSRIISVDEVLTELRAGADELSTWAAGRGGLFAPIDAPRLNSMRLLTAWVNGGSLTYTPGAVQDFLAGADYHLVAHAHAHRLTVVTHEISNQVGRKRVKIPEACEAFGVPYIQPHELLSREQARFDLRPS
jgi:hypothetical protein